MRVGAQTKPLPSVPAKDEADARATDSAAPDESKKAPEKRTAKSQVEIPAPDAPPTKSLPAVSAAQPLASQLPQNASASQLPIAPRPITPLMQSDATPGSNVSANNAPAEAAASNGIQITGTAAQVETAFVQALIDLPPASTVPGNAIPASIEGAASGVANSAAASNQPSSKAAPKPAFEITGSANAIPAAQADAGTNRTTPAASGSHDAPSHDSQSSQNTQGDASQQTSALQKVADSNLSQIQAQTIVPFAPIHEVASKAHLTGNLTGAPQPTDQHETLASHADSVESAATPEIRSAQLIQSINGTEMRVGMQSSEFGDISIRTFMSPQAMHTQISLDHGELSQVMSTHVSSMQTKLGDELGLHASIEINNQGASLSGDAEQSSQRQYGSLAGSMQSARAANPAAADGAISMEMPLPAGNGHQLDIRV